jgi:hypothetical protein
MDSHQPVSSRPTVREARTAAIDFLKESLGKIARVDVIGMAPIHAGSGSWELEVRVWQPNATIQALGLSPEHPVLDREAYLVRLDENLNVVSYGLKEALQDG